MMPEPVPVYLEIAPKRSFAGAIDWPGWCRSGRVESEALAALVDYGRRYAKALGSAVSGFEPPADVSVLDVVERLKGGSGTEFGVPGEQPKHDEQPLKGTELERQIKILQASWRFFDATARKATGLELSKGPRGGGRELDKMVVHLLEGEQAYLRELGGAYQKPPSAEISAEMAAARRAAVEMLRSRAAGQEPSPGPRRKRPFWGLRYFIRRSAWHALDHAWEIEDRVIR